MKKNTADSFLTGRNLLLHMAFLALAVGNPAFGQATADKKIKTFTATDSHKAARTAYPQASGARRAYSESLSTPLQANGKKADSASKAAPQDTASSSANKSTLKVGGVTFIGNSVFSEDELKSLVAADFGKKLTFDQIKGMATKVEDYYHERGYQIAKVIIPKQAMKPGGVLKLQVLEGRLGEVRVSGNKRYSTSRVTDTFYAFTPKERAFTIGEIERPLVLLNSRSGISVNSTLASGAKTGETDVEITVKEDPRVKGTVEFNNFGSEDSGEYRFIPYLALPNMTGAGDELNLFGVVSPDSTDSWYWQAGYMRPINTRGTSINAYYGRGNNQVGNDYAILDIKGENSTWGVGLSHRIIYSARTSLELQSWFEWQDMDQTMLGYKTSDDSTRKIRIGANFDHTDSAGRTVASFYIHQGLGDIMGAMDNNDYYSSRSYAQADNRFTKTVLSVMRLQNFTPSLYGILNFTGQYSVDPLVSGEQMYTGGANTVRGQPQSCYSGDSGILINAELRYSVLPEASLLQLAAFFDHGQTYIQKPIVGQKQWSSLSGAGVGLRSNIYEGLDLRFDVAVPVGPREGDSAYVYGQVRYSF